MTGEVAPRLDHSLAPTLPLVSPKLDFFSDMAQVDADWHWLETTGHCTAFQTRAWLHPFYLEVAPRVGLEPLFLRVTDATTGRPLMLWPLVRQRRLGLQVVSFADAGASDFNAPLVAGGVDAVRENLLWQHSLQALRAQGAVLDLQKLPARHALEANPLLALVAGAEPMGAEKIAAFYGDPVKAQVDQESHRLAIQRRRAAMSTALLVRARRSLHFGRRRVAHLFAS
jgi:CelD/BcsL family acetyltransferase involved in cellulose biosynthesis